MQRRDQRVGHRGQCDDLQQFAVLLIAHALCTGGGGMGVDAVAAAVRGGNRDIDHFPCLRIERAGNRHHGFDLRPCALQARRVLRQRAPDVVYEIGPACFADVVKDGFDVWDRVSFRIRHQFYSRHCFPLRIAVPIAGTLNRQVSSRSVAQLFGSDPLSGFFAERL